jgi:ABC-2 type transport system ATP-binding protein
MLHVRDLTRSYGRHPALRGVDLDIGAGTLACLIGPNGAGKSTLMRVVTGLQSADAGTVVVGGADMARQHADARARAALVPQDVRLVEHLTVRETLELSALFRVADPAQRAARIARAVEVARVADDVDRAVAFLSGGTRRKVAVAAALLADPGLAVLDESFVGLDPESCFSLERELRRWCDDGGAVLLSSHVLDTVERIADVVLVLAEGRIVRRLDRAELLAATRDRPGALTEIYLDATGTRQSTPA